MKKIPRNKQCWAKGCDRVIREIPSTWPYCLKHYRMSLKGYMIDLKVPGIKGFDNTKHD